MWLHDYITIGTAVYRIENRRHRGIVVAIFGPEGCAGRPEFAKGATFRVQWSNGWKEDCDRNEIGRDLSPSTKQPSAPVKPAPVIKRPNGPRNLKAGGFTNGLWRLEERDRAAAANRERRRRVARREGLAFIRFEEESGKC